MRRMVLGTMLIVTLAAGVAVAADAASGWARMQKLVGTWESTAEGKPYTMTFQLISGGSALMESMGAEDMVTMYHLDGERLMMTHYCAAHNQPRMVAEVEPDGKTIRFKLLDITNLADPQAGHMVRMVLAFEDDDHISEQWTFLKNGKETTETFHLTRKK
ncbi:MAG TPA: hypothetical protein VLT85_06195 [Terriglobales bacterium]|nr:hypothetical protein [Terriglobales bacterium]